MTIESASDVFTAARERLEGMRAHATAPKEIPTPPSRWTLDHVILEVHGDQIGARVRPPWGSADTEFACRCHQCVALDGHVLVDDVPTPCGLCAPAREMVRLIGAAGIAPRFAAVARWTQEDIFGPTALAGCRAFVEKWAAHASREAAPWLVLSGPPGQGKSTVAAWLAWRWLAAGKPALWLSWPRLLSAVRACFRDADREALIWARIRSARGLIVVDDLGRGPDAPWARERAGQLLDELRHDAIAVVTSNLPASDWSKAFGGAVSSRLLGRASAGQTVVTLKGSDLRRTP